MSAQTREIEDIYPLSPMQQGMLYHSIYSPDSAVYIEQTSCTLVGDLNIPAFEHAWETVIRRYTILRTSFVWEDLDEPLQVVHHQVEPPLSIEDWRTMARQNQQETVDKLLADDLQQGFDLMDAPLMRLKLIRLEDNEYKFVWTHHHLLLDGWSMPVLFQEVFSNYEANRQGIERPARPAKPYRDYIAWLQKQDLAQAEAYWREYLKGFQAPTPLVVDRIDPTVTSEILSHKITLGAEATSSLRKAAQQSGVTLNTWMQAAWALLLSRYSGDEDVMFGATVAGRPANLPGADKMVGIFINTLPVRALINPDQRVVDWLRDFQSQQSQARQFEYSPLVQIQSWSDVPPGNPLFNSILVFENYPVEASLKEQRGSLEIRDIGHYGQTNYLLTLSVSPGTEFGIQIIYDRQRFEPDVIARMAGHLKQILLGMIADALRPKDSELPLRNIKMLTHDEEIQLLTVWNHSDGLVSEKAQPEVSVIHLFETQVAQTPSSVALELVGKDGQISSLTYQQLDQISDRLANQLKNLGVGADVSVGISFERSLEMVIALLGVLKAGGEYVPLDPKYPGERLLYMLQDAGIKILLTQTQLSGGWEMLLGELDKTQYPVNIICLDQGELSPLTPLIDADSASTSKYSSQLNPGQPAYVIYTSGSTGLPKGVIVPHQALANHAQHLSKILDLGPGERIPQLISLNFDAAGEEIYPLLVSGATLVIPNPEFELTGKNLLDFCRDYQITEIHLPVPLWNPIVDEIQRINDNGSDEPAMPPSLRLILVGGESPMPERLRIWSRAATRPMQFINAYGPTEATITSLVYKITVGAQVEASSLEELSVVPVGRPIPNAEVYLLDKDKNPVPIGIPGEIYIGGAGLAIGYLNRPEITAERFLPNPFGPGKLYRTGDLCRYRPDGNIEFAGRIDYQVKLRGYRIELEEIEAVIRQYSAIEDAAVILREDQPGDKRLVAYLEPRPDYEDAAGKASKKPIAIESVRDFLKERLPDYMVPAWFVLLPELPRTPTGKVDRRAIARMPAPEGTSLVGAAYVAPRDAVEEIIAGLWIDVLGVSAPGVYDNFFDLGGHSLKATQLLSRIRQTFQVDLQLRSLFESPTIADMAVVIRSAVSGEGLSVSTIQPIERDPLSNLPLEAPPLSFSQQRLWFLDQLEPGDLSSNIPAAVRILGDLDIPALEKSLNALIQRHESLRTTFKAQEGRPVQIIAPDLTLVLPVSKLQSGEGQDAIDLWARQQVQIPFDLAEGPLIRAAILTISDKESLLVITIHHIVSDGWSMGIFIRDIAILYEAYSSGREPSLEPLKLQYADYAAWQRAWLSGEELDRQLNYWKTQLAGMPPLLELPTDRPRPALKSSNGALESFVFPDELSESIQALARQEGVTVYMLTLAAFQTLLYRYSGQTDIAVGSAIANRTRPEIEDIIGFFVNTLVLRTDLSGAPSFKELLRRVREVALGAYNHQDLPFETLVEAIQPQRNLSYTPLFQVGFDLQEIAVKNLELPALTLMPVSAHAGSAAFDLLMSINQSPGKLSGSLEYNTDLFDRSTILRLLGNFKQLLESIVAEPDTEISVLQYLSEAEKHQIILDWNNSDAEFARELSIHQLFEKHASQNPDSLALAFRGVTDASTPDAETTGLTYAELNRKANILARFLRLSGVGPDTLVGISTERSFEMIIAILGILKAGGAYLPLDPNYPVDRLGFMLDDSKVSIVLTQDKVQRRLSDLFSSAVDKRIKIVCLDLDWEKIEQTARIDANEKVEENLPILTTPENLAYIIYTSGSTGRPKGTLLRNRGLCNLVEWQRKYFEIDRDSRVLQFSPFSFDASVWETFMALANGASLCLASQDTMANGLELIRLMKDLAVTTVTLPPSVLSVIPVELVTIEALPSLRTVIAAGEACTREIVERWAPGRRFVDAYGPTETTVCASAGLVEPDDLREPSIGRPIANTHLYVLDANRQPVPVGVPAELMVGGVGVAKGYLNRPDLTEEKFIANPLAGYLRNAGYIDRAQERLYRTGDLVRYRPDGNLEFLGRIDEQVKVRGYRIELGEIETALRQYTEIRPESGGQIRRLKESAVVVREDQPGDKRLVAFIVPENIQAATEMDNQPGAEDASLLNALRKHLRQSLPEYMVPSQFVILESLPLSPSGKIDRRTLATQPLSGSGREQTSAVYVAPRNETEQQLCKICAELLNIPWTGEQSPIGIYDNFFELGGHSLLATQFISRVRDSFQIELPLRVLFEHPTVAEMAEAVEKMKQSSADIGVTADGTPHAESGKAAGRTSAEPIRPVSRESRRMRQTAGGFTAAAKTQKEQTDGSDK